MAGNGTSWRRLTEDGAEWEARAVSGGPDGGNGDVLEFVCVDGSLKARRLAGAGPVDRMDEDELRRAFRQARPIGGDHYGRPGKRPGDSP